MHAAERLQTMWLPILKQGNTLMPQLEVRFTAVGSEIRGVKVRVVELAPEYVKQHPRLMDEWKDPEMWPKHLVMDYKWTRYEDEDIPSGIFVLLSSSVVTFAIVGLLARLKFGPKVDSSVNELLSTVDDAAANPAGAGPSGRSTSNDEASSVAVGSQQSLHRAAALQAAHAKGGHVD